MWQLFDQIEAISVSSRLNRHIHHLVQQARKGSRIVPTFLLT